VAVRRIADKVVRIRAERFDKAPVINTTDTGLMRSLGQLGFAPAGPHGSRISMTCHTSRDVSFLIGVLAHMLLRREFDHTQFLVQEEPGAAEWQKRVEATMADKPEAFLETEVDKVPYANPEAESEPEPEPKVNVVPPKNSGMN